MKAIDAVTKIRTAAEQKLNAEPVMHLAMRAGEYHRQGDVYITRLSRLPAHAEQIPTVTQLVPGTTQGARHCLASVEGVTMYRVANPTALDGPVIRCAQQTTITHPEHGDVTVPPGTYRITYQREYAEELRRVAD